MHYSDFERAVASATGESLREIRRRGFGPADNLELGFDPEPSALPPQVVDWDVLDERRVSLFP